MQATNNDALTSVDFKLKFRHFEYQPPSSMGHNSMTDKSLGNTVNTYDT